MYIDNVIYFSISYIKIQKICLSIDLLFMNIITQLVLFIWNYAILVYDLTVINVINVRLASDLLDVVIFWHAKILQDAISDINTFRAEYSAPSRCARETL